MLSHLLAQIDQPGIREQIVHEIQEVFDGKVIWGEDLMKLGVVNAQDHDDRDASRVTHDRRPLLVVAARPLPSTSRRRPRTSPGSGPSADADRAANATPRGDMGSGWGSTFAITQDARAARRRAAVCSRRYDLQPQSRFVYALDGIGVATTP